MSFSLFRASLAGDFPAVITRYLRNTSMPSCYVPGCSNSHAKGYTLVRYPKDDALRKKWHIAVGGVRIPTHNNRICEVHFEDDAWVKKPKLNPEAVPSLFCTCRKDVSFCEAQSSQEQTLPSMQDHCYSGSNAQYVPQKRRPLATLNTNFTDHLYSSPAGEHTSLGKHLLHQPECPIFSRKQSLTPILQPLQNVDTSIFIKSVHRSHVQRAKSPSPSPPPSPLKKKSKHEQLVTEENRRLRAELDKLKTENNAAEKMVSTLREQLVEQDHFWGSKFGADQVACVLTGNSKGRKWSTDSVIKGLQIRYTGGSSGLKTASNTAMPLPGVRTLQRRTQNILFAPGILYEILDSFKDIVADYEENDRDCTLIWDEMSIKNKAALWDPGTDSFIGGCSFPGMKDEAATKALVFLLAGVRKKWKTTAAYHFVPSRGCTQEVKSVILDILSIAKDMGLNVVGLVCDMGNRGVLTSLGFSFKKDSMKNWIVNPVHPGKILYCFPDAVHVFKSHKEVFMANEDAELPQDIVDRFGLPSRFIQFNHIRMLADYQENMDVKFAPKLNKNDLDPNHFSKMKVHSATKVINDKTAEGLKFLVYKEEIPVECATTAWYVKVINRWFNLVTSRGHQLALSQTNPEEYHKALEDLQLVLEVMNGLMFSGGWKVVQTHLIIATASLLAIQGDLLAKDGYEYLCLGRFLQDAIENLFSVVRYQRPTPSALEFKYRLKQIVLGKLAFEVKNSSYSMDDRHEAVGLEKLLSLQKKVQPQVDVYLPLWEEPDAPEPNGATENVLYRMCGYAIHSLKRKNRLKCPSCLSAVVQQGSSHHHFSTFTLMTNYAEGAQVEVSNIVFELLRRVEFNLQRWKSFLRQIDDRMSDVVLDRIHPHTSDVNISQCHPEVTKKIVSKFVLMRLKQFSMEFTPGLGFEASSLSSKSMGGRYLAEQFKQTKAKNRTAIPRKGQLVSQQTARRLTL